MNNSLTQLLAAEGETVDDRNAYRLAETMHGTWPTTGPTRAAWYDMLHDLDESTATAAFHAIRRGNQRYVLAAFNDEYTRITRRVTVDQPAGICRACDGSGTITVPLITIHGYEYTRCEPCEYCTLGHAVAKAAVWREQT